MRDHYRAVICLLVVVIMERAKGASCKDGIIAASGAVCCPKTCLRCGGRQCKWKPDGPSSCCEGIILEHGPPCGESTRDPPCRMASMQGPPGKLQCRDLFRRQCLVEQCPRSNQTASRGGKEAACEALNTLRPLHVTHRGGWSFSVQLPNMESRLFVQWDTPTFSTKRTMELQHSGHRHSDVTVILNVYKRTSLQSQIYAILNQTRRPLELWVCIFASPQNRSMLEIVERAKKLQSGVTLHSIVSSYNFKYFGRFQLAMQVTTKYAAIVDDDQVLGARVLENFERISNNMREHVILGQTGRLFMQQDPTAGVDAYFMRDHGGHWMESSTASHCRKGGVELTEVAGFPLLEVDALNRHWFLRRDTVRQLFAEQTLTFATMEDYMLSAYAAKHAGVFTYVVCGTTSKQDANALDEHGVTSSTSNLPGSGRSRYTSSPLHFTSPHVLPSPLHFASRPPLSTPLRLTSSPLHATSPHVLPSPRHFASPPQVELNIAQWTPSGTAC